MSNSERKRPLKLQRHCWRLATLLQELWQHDPVTVTNKDGVTFEYSDAAEWLDLASSVEKVDILTGSFDDSVMYCGTAMEYEDARSYCLSLFVGQLTIFTFVWGAFEIVGNIIQPPAIPPQFRKHGENSLVDRLIYLLQTISPLPGYVEALDRLNRAVDQIPEYRKHRRLEPHPAFFGPSGVGIDFVRRVRNQFAHGAARFPQPDDWGEDRRVKPSPDQVVIAFCTPITLLTIQMLLEVYFGTTQFDVRGADGDDEDVHEVIRTLHIDEPSGE